MNFICSFNKFFYFPTFWENEVLLNALLSIYFLYFIINS